MLTLFASFSLQASAPFMPDKTAIEITDIPSERRSDYQFNVVTFTTPDVEFGPFNSTEYFVAGALYEPEDPFTVNVYYKESSQSSWVYVGCISSNDNNMDLVIWEGYVTLASFSWDDLEIPE